MNNIADNIRSTIVVSLEELRDKIIDNHRNVGQVASGKTINSLLVTPKGNGAELTGRKYFGTLETGRKQGKTPRNFNEIIQQWILDKGIPVTPIPYKRQPSEKWQPKYNEQQRGLVSMAGAIAHKIATEGTSLYRNGGRKDIYTGPIDETIKEIRKKLAGIFKTEIQRL